MPTDGQTGKFLYTILKQLDLKSIDWNEVADQLDITNGHAARMRFSRFKQHMEGIPPVPRKSRPNVPRHKKPKHETHTDHESKVKDENEPAAVKPEPMSIDEQVPNAEPATKPEDTVKEEQAGEGDSEKMAEMTDSFQASAFEALPLGAVKKQEPMVKTEVYWDE
ncbi:hypothetical protein LPUS_10243 [Lasallia pustulata]|uniref:Myb-like DNA-binding domain-containing protein n=1 Tax=Lasallia pustulata TaxID=136370 RepID=A0A1W5D954_9LECA|nr:hypothetical protein LPUS_10243 [Lasallia pustulata]